jgi:hypothetical protein
MKKENIYVEITNETERLRAIEILQNAGEVISKNDKQLRPIKWFKYLVLKNEGWFVSISHIDKTKITLDELEALLNPKKSNVFTDVQEWIRENYPEREYTFVNRKLPGCFKRLEVNLINDYPKGTTIKISKDKIEIYHS